MRAALLVCRLLLLQGGGDAKRGRVDSACEFAPPPAASWLLCLEYISSNSNLCLSPCTMLRTQALEGGNGGVAAATPSSGGPGGASTRESSPGVSGEVGNEVCKPLFTSPCENCELETLSQR